MIPFLTAYLLWSERETIFSIEFEILQGRPEMLLISARGDAMARPGGSWAVSRAPARFAASAEPGDNLDRVFRRGFWKKCREGDLFPLLLLLLAIPLPEVILSRVVYALEKGFTDITYAIFETLRVPTLRDGFFLTVPGITIEVAPECSGIRSSVAMLITCLLAGAALYFADLVGKFGVHDFGGSRAMINGIRIATLTLLSLYVDPSFLKGSLHRDGGFVFFFIGLRF